MKIILHIGQSKTGTSAIQTYLSKNREYLKKSGVLFPSVNKGRFKIDLENQNALADSLLGVSRFPNLTTDEYFEQFFQQAKEYNCHTLILSAEHFFGGEPRVWDVNKKDYFNVYAKKIKRLKQYLQGHDLKIIAYLRPQVDWVASAIGQTIRVERLIGNRNIFESERQFFELVKPTLKYEKLIDLWSSILSPQSLVLVPYEKKNLHGASSITDFLHRLDLGAIELPLYKQQSQVNQSLTREYIELKKLLNKKTRGKARERAIIKCLEKLSRASHFSSVYSLPEDLIVDIERYCQKGNERLDSYTNESFVLPVQSFAYKERELSVVETADLLKAKKLFEIEFRNISTQLSMLNEFIKAFLRKRMKSTHALLHYFKKLHGRLRGYLKS